MDSFWWTIDVGWTNTRPVIPEQHVSRVRVFEPDEYHAVITAAAWVKARPGWRGMKPAEMVTSTKIVEVEL